MGIYVFEMGGLRVAATAASEGMPERFGCLLVESVWGRDESVGGAAADFLLDIVFEDVVEGGGFRARATGANCFEFGMRGVFCEIDLDGGRGLLRVVRDESAVEYSMKLLFGAMLGIRGGGLMHAAALARDGKGRIFCGPPGAGKSTLAGIASGGREAGAARTLNDELAVVVADKGNGGARVYALPEWADGGTMRDAGAAGPSGVAVAAVYVLCQAGAGEATAFERLTGAEAAGAVFSNMRFALPAPEAIRAGMEAADVLRRSVAVSRMRFSLADAPRFWEVVDEFESGR
ncbi:MAG: hypothetical protein BWY28_02732 [bacterium ADurb.Bin236]|nr:MAG: hypothetical protein BWY28_02732 [bacterium ADurb.Bin236]